MFQRVVMCVSEMNEKKLKGAKGAKTAGEKDPFEKLVDYVNELEEGAPPRQQGFDHGGE